MNRTTFVRVLAAGPLAAGIPHAALADTEVHFITVTGETAATPVFAERQGFFKRTGLDVNLTVLTNGAAVASAVLGGSADVGVSNPISLAIAHQHGAPLVAFAPTAYYTNKAPASLLLAAKNSPIHSGKDLTGKIVAVNGLQNTSQLATAAWIDKTGGDAKSVKWLEMPYAEMAIALESGRVEAAFCTEPSLTPALATTRVLADTYGGVAPQWLVGIFITTVAYARQHPEIVTNLAAALHDAAGWANTHPDETAAITSSITKIDIALIRRMVRARFAERLLPEDLQPPIDLAARYGVLAKTFPARDLIWPA